MRWRVPLDAIQPATTLALILGIYMFITEPAHSAAVPGCEYGGGKGHSLCIGHPKGCLKDNSCKIGLSVLAPKVGGNTASLFLVALIAEAKGYVSMALGGSPLMGRDITVDCVNERGCLLVGPGENNRDHSHSRLPVQMYGASVQQHFKNFSSGVISCGVLMHQVVDTPRKQYVLNFGSWYMQLAAGDVVTNGIMQKHKLWVRTKKKHKLTMSGTIEDFDFGETNSNGSPAMKRTIILLLLCILVAPLIPFH